MPEPPSSTRGSELRLLEQCTHDLNLARSRLSAGRHARVSRWEEQQLRADLVTALEKYADALAAGGLPLPYRIRDELALYRRIGERG
ncbi:hypothetical protein [Nocardioides sp. YIM 152315]|uniref:hypothetical protein n=1 Tax=Nocardioides sp. YIM 152315 TaxID=3031760 RepID=UPI0023DC3AFB|nr:hypothetical protein [Nocardioides sp. YIM 152315]MDF1603185.1 hypothetical protein [Nocardioides sp. YIM 152315]